MPFSWIPIDGKIDGDPWDLNPGRLKYIWAAQAEAPNQILKIRQGPGEVLKKMLKNWEQGTSPTTLKLLFPMKSLLCTSSILSSTLKSLIF